MPITIIGSIAAAALGALMLLLNGCGKRTEEEKSADTNSKDDSSSSTPPSFPVPIAPSSSSVSDNPRGEVDDSAEWIPFLKPMVYCRPKAWLEYWNPKLNENVYNIDFEMPAAETLIVADPHCYYFSANEIKALPVWYRLEWTITDAEFIKVDDWIGKAEVIDAYVNNHVKNGENLQSTHMELHGNTIGEYMIKICSDFSMESTFAVAQKKILEKKQQGKKLTLNPAILVAVMYTEGTGKYETCMGTGLAGEAIATNDPIGEATRILLTNFLIGEYFLQNGLFEPGLYVTDEGGQNRSDDFKGLTGLIQEYTTSDGKWKENYGPCFNVNDSAETTFGYRVDYITGMENTEEWATANSAYKEYLDGFPFLIDSAGLFARLKYNTWLYFPSRFVDESGEVTIDIGLFNAQLFCDDVKKVLNALDETQED